MGEYCDPLDVCLHLIPTKSILRKLTPDGYRLSILESPNNLLLYPSLREGWFDCNPWAFLIDQCLLGLDGVLVQRYVPSIADISQYRDSSLIF